MLIGQYQTALSPKRRVAVPKPFRVLLGEKIIIARWYEKCLVLVSLDGWEKIMTKLTYQAQIATEPVRDTERFILGSAYQVTPDDQGRVVIPEMLAIYAGLKGKITFLGLGGRVEAWDSDFWEKREKYVSENAAQLLEQIASGKAK